MPVMNLVDAVITYRILKMLVTPWNKTAAYQLGIIDKNGVPLKKAKDLDTSEEQEAYTVLTRLVFKLKRILGKIPMVNKNLTNLAAAAWLIKECLETGKDTITEEDYTHALTQDLSEQLELIEKYNKENPNLYLTMLILREEGEGGVPANNVGGGKIAGTTGDPVRRVVSKILRRRKKAIS